ncbi:MAG: WYL domain-containing protein [Bacteroidaceae bacterium]|nr:WYL domain-containing protein [Bacteroidaceae bacterium]
MARTAGSKKMNTREEMLAICKALDSGTPQSLEELLELVNGLRQGTGEKRLTDESDLYGNHIRRLRLILEEAQELGEIDDEKDIERIDNNIVAFSGIYDLYVNRGRRNMIPGKVIEFVRGNINYAVLNQIQNWLLDKDEDKDKDEKKPKKSKNELPEKFISIEDSLYIGKDEDKKRELLREQRNILLLAKSILGKKALKITYLPNALGGQTDELIFSPEYLRRVGRKWMVYGMSESKQFPPAYVNLVLSRIKQITDSDIPYTPSGVDYTDDPFKEQMTYHGFRTCSRKKEKVVLKVRKEKPGYTSGTKIYPFVRIQQEPLHYSQAVIREDKNYGYISIDITDAMFIRPILLTWGADVEVIEPSALREQMRQEVATMQVMYAPKASQ